MAHHRWTLIVLLVSILSWTVCTPADARPPIRTAFFNVYPSAVDSRLDDLPSSTRHCGVCHFDFDGGGQRNDYGLQVQAAIDNFPTYEEAIASLDDEDSDNDGYDNVVEITSTLFANTPTFPGLRAGNVGNVSNIPLSEIQDYLTPSGGTDTTPPDVTLLAPVGGETFQAGTTELIQWTATDASGISHVNIYMSDDDGVTFKPVARGEPDDGTYDWFVPNLPGTSTEIQVEAIDNAGNPGSDDSDSFTVLAISGGTVPTTLRDFELAGTQPFEGGVLDNPETVCATCHGNYDQAVEPWYNWRGTMMGNAARDPLFLATLVVAEQDAPSVGDLCLRCHTPGGWQEGRSTDTSGGMLLPKDRHSVQCDFCHRQVDPIYKPGISPPEDVPILDALAALPLTYANGQFVTDPDPIRRGPFADPLPVHPFLESPFHRSSDLCGTCHDVSNPAFEAGAGPGEYVPTPFDAPHPDGDLRNMFPVERTFSEWSMSDYATTGVFAPEFAGNKPDGVVSTCQDCHMKDVEGQGCNDNQAPVRPDLPLHDLTGGNTFVTDILDDFYPGEVDVQALADAKQRTLDLLQLAATMDLLGTQVSGFPAVEVTLTNETGHKLPSGYPEGRRMWINVKAFDEGSNLIYESGAYDPATGVLTHDPDVKIYQIKPGISYRLANLLGAPELAAPGFHFVLNDSVWSDNRIPPRGFTNANFEAIQSPPVGYSYADGQYWDTTTYQLPAAARLAEVTFYYQTTSKEYIEFLRDENTTNNLGQQLHDAWVNQGRAAPVAVVTDTVHVSGSTAVAAASTPRPAFALEQNTPNPFNPATRIGYAIPEEGRVELRILDVGGRVVRILVDEEKEAGVYEVTWDGRNAGGAEVASGLYLYEIRTARRVAVKKAVLMR